ncbi:MAG: response regulator [Trueperaceae bacterium]|nr:response regulator [Trueperaceae bacterium]
MINQTLEIAIIDDDEVDREIVFRLLKGQHTCYEAATEQEAYALLDEKAIDCVLLDYHLPKADTFKLLSYCVEQFIPVIVLTGDERPGVIVKTLQQGAQDYLVKGEVNQTILNYAIANALEKVSLRKRLDEKNQSLAEKNEQLRKLASDLSLAEQRERHRIAQILHDDLQQQVYGAQIMLRTTQRQLPDSATARINAVYEQLEQIIRISRELTVDLSPPVLKGEGLYQALRWLSDEMYKRYELQVLLYGENNLPVPSEVMRIFLFRVIRELLFNVVKHGETLEAVVRLQRKEQDLLITVEDHGRGFDPGHLENHGGFGLYSVKEQMELFGGSFELSSKPGSGTVVSLGLPAYTLT